MLKMARSKYYANKIERIRRKYIKIKKPIIAQQEKLRKRLDATQQKEMLEYKKALFREAGVKLSKKNKKRKTRRIAWHK
tara:strand:+ start:435 stop:671 length:237 start_codon:yes stop_codon:yes gene_type:complete